MLQQTLGRVSLGDAAASAAKSSFFSTKGYIAGRNGPTASFPGRRSLDTARLAALQAQSVAELDAARKLAARRSQASLDLQVGASPAWCAPAGCCTNPAPGARPWTSG